MEHQNDSKIDRSVSTLLQERFGSCSRRSLLSKLTRCVFRAAGVAVAGRAMLEMRPAAAQGGGGNWQHCGLKGVVCDTGTCTSVGTIAGGAWSRCCKDPSCDLWVGCTYKDYCKAAAPAHGFMGCDGVWPPPAFTPSWCGNLTHSYWCTTVNCQNQGGKATEAACNQNHAAGDTCAWVTCDSNTTGNPCGTCKPDTTSSSGWRCNDGSGHEGTPA